jgi:hypothetical protein
VFTELAGLKVHFKNAETQNLCECRRGMHGINSAVVRRGL